MVGESNQNVFLIQLDASSFAEFEISEFEILRFDYCCWEECKKVPTLIRRCVREVTAGLGLHIVHVSKCPFFHDAGHLDVTSHQISAIRL